MSAYEHARQLAADGRSQEAREGYLRLADAEADQRSKALILSDLAALDAVEGRCGAARAGFAAALALDPDCEPARSNIALLGAGREFRVAIVSLLFNWPSTGGGIVHTWELAKFLGSAGYRVRHFYASFAPWELGQVSETLPFDSVRLAFDETNWNAASIQARFRDAVSAFSPDCVVITDSWNFKPLLAEAVRAYPYVLRLQAQECLCPLNNLRLLFDGRQPVQCDLHQLSTPDQCIECVRANGSLSGPLHRRERALAGFGTEEYDRKLRAAFRDAHTVLVVNPLHAAMVRPFSRAVRVAPSGFDPARFAPVPKVSGTDRKTTLFFAGLTHEFFKGFHVLQQACESMAARRSDFRLLVTGDSTAPADGYTSYTGWLSQDELPKRMAEADIVMVPTVGQDALGRTAVEAMGAGRPVIASRIGGLPFTVTDGETGLLFEPGNAPDLARKIEILLDNPWLRRAMGEAGRQRFAKEFTWESVIERHYRPMFSEIGFSEIGFSEIGFSEIGQLAEAGAAG